MEVKVIEQSGRDNEYLTRYASPLQLLENLREHAGKSNNLPGYESMSRLIQLIKIVLNVFPSVLLGYLLRQVKSPRKVQCKADRP